jgi:flagellar secretion chaperone FliS
MPVRNNALAAYGSVANTESDPLQQLVMLYDGAIKFFRLAAADIEAGEVAAKAEHSNRALDIVIYLQSVLDFERGGDVAPALDALYLNVMATALKASAALDAAQMRHAAELLAPVREAWAVNASGSAEGACAPTSPLFAPSAPVERLRVTA